MIQMPVAGTLYSMMKNQKLQMKWDWRQKNLNMPKGNEENQQIAQLRKDAERVRRANMIMSIDGKLKAGEKLSPDEMDYLRENCPQLYQEAVEVAMEREQYRKALEKCKTKEDVERLNANKMQSFLSQAKSISSNPNIPATQKQELLDKVLRRLMGTKAEHMAFTRTPQYADLPREAEIEDEKAKKKEKPVQSAEQDEELDKIQYPQEPYPIDKPTDLPEGENTADRPSEPSEKPQDGAAPSKPEKGGGTKHSGATDGAARANGAASPATAYTAAAAPARTAAPTQSPAVRPVKISLRA